MPISNVGRNEMKSKNYHTVGTVAKPDRKIVERG